MRQKTQQFAHMSGVLVLTPDELLLYCYHYDPASGRYGAMVMNLVRLGGVVTVVLLGGFILLMRRYDKVPAMEGHA
jgi:protein SCO1/2